VRFDAEDYDNINICEFGWCLYGFAAAQALQLSILIGSSLTPNFLSCHEDEKFEEKAI